MTVLQLCRELLLLFFFKSEGTLKMRTLKDLFIAVVQAQYKQKMEMAWYCFLAELFFYHNAGVLPLKKC